VSRRAVLVFIHLFLAVQVILPLSYYVARADRYDERFAWRMFSAERMVSCSPVFRVGPERKPAQLHASFHEAWVNLARRGRHEVLEAMAARLCADNQGQPVRLEMVCHEPIRPGEEDDPRRPGFARVVPHEGLWDLCPSGRLK
jgi:hypothetical protein